MINSHTWLQIPKNIDLSDPKWFPKVVNEDTEMYPLYVQKGTEIGLPRCHGISLAKRHDIVLKDVMIDGRQMNDQVAFNGTLVNTIDRPQIHAVNAINKAWETPYSYSGIVAGHTGFGKTVVAIAAAIQRNRCTLILVHTEELLQQWKTRISQWSPMSTVGLYRGSTCIITGCDFIVATLQTIYSRRDNLPSELINNVGTIIVDEVHHIAARTFCSALQCFPARARLGLSATPRRGDGLTHVLHMLLGDVIFKTEYQPGQVIVDVHPIHWNVVPQIPRTRNEHMRRNLIYQNLASNNSRTVYIAKIIKEAVTEGRHILVISRLLKHLKALHQLIPNSGLLIGEASTKQRQKVLNESQVILAIDRLAKEGLDVPALDTLVLTMPLQGVQYYGRITRFDSKTKRAIIPKIIDFDDIEFLECHEQVQTRFYLYRKYNFTVVRTPPTAPLALL